jgi:hypothetical protein
MNDGKWTRVDFTCSIRHSGFFAEFRDGDDKAQLPNATRTEYEAAKDSARIFCQTRDGVSFSASELLDWYLKKTGTELKDYVPKPLAAEAFSKGKAIGRVSFPITLTPSSFHMRTTAGVKDISCLTLFVDFTVLPKMGA